MELQGWITYLTSLGLASRYSVCCLGTSGLHRRNASSCVTWPQLPELYGGERERQPPQYIFWNSGGQRFQILFSELYTKKPQTQDSSQQQWFSSSYEILHGCLTRHCAGWLRWQMGASQGSRADTSKGWVVSLWGWITLVGHLLLSTGWGTQGSTEGNSGRQCGTPLPWLSPQLLRA